MIHRWYRLYYLRESVLIMLLFFASECAKTNFVKWFEHPAVFWYRNPENFENSLIPRYKLKIKIGFVFDRGQDYCILLDFSVYLLHISYLKTSSNQRLGVRSVVLWKYASVVEFIIFMWTAEVQIYWQSPLLFCGLFDFFALWLARDVSPAAGELRFDDLWWHVAWRVSGNICLWLFMLNISVSLLLVMFKHKGQYLKRILLLHQVC